MKSITKYQCSVCMTLWDTAELAVNCELTTHRKVEGAKIVSIGYSPRPGLYNLEARVPDYLPGRVCILFPEMRMGPDREGATLIPARHGSYVYQRPTGA